MPLIVKPGLPHPSSLADFGQRHRSPAASAVRGRPDRLRSPSGLGQVSALTLKAAPGFGPAYTPTAAQADASPGALSGNGSSFTVNWQRPEIQMPAPPVILVRSHLQLTARTPEQASAPACARRCSHRPAAGLCGSLEEAATVWVSGKIT